MNRRTALLLLLAIVAGALVGYYGLSSPREEPQGLDARPVVAATLFPVYDMAREIAGDHVRVELILPPGASPHSYEPMPSDIRRLQGIDAVYAIGLGMDDWALSVAQDADVIRLWQEGNLELRVREDGHHDEADEGDDHSHGEFDPHYWLSVDNAREMLGIIRDDLSARYPEHAESFDIATEAYWIKLKGTHVQMSEMHADLPSRKIVTLHDAWYYFAKNTGLEITGSFEENPGLEPTPQYLAELSRAVAESGARAIYAEPQLSTSGLEAFARDNGLAIAVLDPLGGVPGRESFIDLLLYNARQIAENQ